MNTAVIANRVPGHREGGFFAELFSNLTPLAGKVRARSLGTVGDAQLAERASTDG